MREKGSTRKTELLMDNFTIFSLNHKAHFLNIKLKKKKKKKHYLSVHIKSSSNRVKKKQHVSHLLI